MDYIMELSLKTKKRFTNISTGVFFLFSGIEYAIIMPTVYLYIQDLGGDPSFLGLVLAAFSLSGLICAPIFGVLQDRYHNTKTLVLVANCFEIIGNFLYFVGINLMMLLGSRLVAGIGAGVGSSLFAQIARTTTEAERVAAISMVMAARQIGLLFGPGLNLFLKDADFCLFGLWDVNAFSSAGIFMCMLWILLQIFIFFFYFDLPPLSEEEQRKPEQNTSNSQPIKRTSRELTDSVAILSSGRPRIDRNTSQSVPADWLIGNFEDKGIINITPMWGSSSVVEDARPRALTTTSGSRKFVRSTEFLNSHRQDVLQNIDMNNDLYDLPNDDTLTNFPTLEIVKEDDELLNGSSGYGSTDQKSCCENLKGNTQPKSWKDEYLREEIVVLLASNFIFFFNQTVLETALTPMTQKLLNFGELENSLLYCACGVELLIGFAAVKYLSKNVSDRVLLLAGFVIELVSAIWFIVFYPDASPDHRSYNMMWFSIGVVIQVSGLAFLAVSIISLFSKLTHMETQGLSQGIRRAIGGLATILGPLWAGSTVQMGYVMFGVITSLFTFIVIFVLVSWPKLKAPADIAKQKMKISPDLFANDDASPLLMNADDEHVNA